VARPTCASPLGVTIGLVTVLLLAGDCGDIDGLIGLELGLRLSQGLFGIGHLQIVVFAPHFEMISLLLASSLAPAKS